MQDPDDYEPQRGPMHCEYCGAFLGLANERTGTRTEGYPGSEYTVRGSYLQCSRCGGQNVYHEETVR